MPIPPCYHWVPGSVCLATLLETWARIGMADAAPPISRPWTRRPTALSQGIWRQRHPAVAPLDGPILDLRCAVRARFHLCFAAFRVSAATLCLTLPAFAGPTAVRGVMNCSSNGNRPRSERRPLGPSFAGRSGDRACWRFRPRSVPTAQFLRIAHRQPAHRALKQALG